MKPRKDLELEPNLTLGIQNGYHAHPLATLSNHLETFPGRLFTCKLSRWRALFSVPFPRIVLMSVGVQIRGKGDAQYDSSFMSVAAGEYLVACIYAVRVICPREPVPIAKCTIFR